MIEKTVISKSIIKVLPEVKYVYIFSDNIVIKEVLLKQ